jgi:early secretory antigenic target protein ESAT-6
MTSGHIKVAFGTVSGAGDEVRRSAATIKGELEDLLSSVSRVAETWEGTAQEHYRVRQNQWNAAADDLHAVLVSIANALDTAAEDYRATEAKNAGIWG